MWHLHRRGQQATGPHQEERVVSSADGDEPSDYLLLLRYRRGSQEAARHIYRRYAARLRGLAKVRCASSLPNHVDVDDIVQSVFSTFFHSARRGRYEIADGEDLWKLFLVIALNRIRTEETFHLAAKRDRRLTAEIECFAPSSRTKMQTPETPADGFLKLVIDEALERLPSEHRIIVQKRMEGYEVAEIAEVVGRSKRSVERILQESRSKLSVLLQDH
jgi:RNA polymerase sigma-70 factor (ECF subfamily)